MRKKSEKLNYKQIKKNRLKAFKNSNNYNK